MKYILLALLLLTGCEKRTRYVMAPCPVASPSPSPSLLTSIDCEAVPRDKGVYSSVKGDEAYLVINISDTDWITDSNRLVLETNVEFPPNTAGVEHRLYFGPTDIKKIAPTWVKIELDLEDVGATYPRADQHPAFYFNVVSESGCPLGSHWVPFGHGNP